MANDQKAPAVARVRTFSTSQSSADILGLQVLDETSTTRKVLEGTVTQKVENGARKCGLHVAILHQRKGKADQWEPVGRPLSELRANEMARLQLDTPATKKLYETLDAWLAVSRGGVKQGVKSHVVFVEDAIGKGTAKVGDLIAMMAGKFPRETLLALARIGGSASKAEESFYLLESRSKALDEFRASLELDKSESYWKAFFERNDWIFGYGLEYRFLQPVAAGIGVGGRDLSGSGEMTPDNIVATAGDTGFVVIVEIKKPTTPLLCSQPYRVRCFSANPELAGGIAQVQAACRELDIRSATDRHVGDSIDSQRLYALNPNGILVIGHTRLLASRDHKESFALLRRSLANPTIVTFDELYARAKFIVARTKKEADKAAGLSKTP